MSPSKALVVPFAAGVAGAPCLLKRLPMAAGRREDEDDDVMSEDENVRLVLLSMLCVLEEGVAERSTWYAVDGA